jgi:hypothetical protein
MKNLLLVLILNFAWSIVSNGQGTMRGKITDENGETIIGATVVQKDNHSVWSVADLDGAYSIKIPDSLPHVVVVSFISLKTIEENVQLKDGAVIVRNFTLKSAAVETREAQVTAKAVKAREYYTEMIKKNSATTLDYISSETMKKTGDVNVVAAVARVTGVSTNGGFITVRGIGDRYVKTAINGSVIPTLDPFTNNFKLDLIPASLVDNVIITKTASPELPGDWAGAYLSVETKDYPEELSVNVEASVGYNNQSTFKDVLSSQHSSTDWLGYDNSFRDHNHDDFVSNVETPTTYQQFVALGLGPYFNSLGVTQSNWNASSETYFRLGLVELGLLEPALINDEIAFENARSEYINGSYASDAFKTINANVPASGKSFPNNWNTTTRSGPLDISQGLSIGNQTKLFGKPLGFLFGYRYGSSVRYDENSTASRARYDGTLESSASAENSVEVNGWSALMNLSFKPAANHSVSLLFMPNFTGVNKVQDAIDSNDSTRFVLTKTQFYEQRKQLVYQFKSEHYFPAYKTKLELNASYTNGKSSVPDFKNLQYWKDEKNNVYSIGGEIGNGIHRYYRYLTDNIFDSRAALEFPIGTNPGLVRKIKTGGAYQRNDKRSDQYDYSLELGDHTGLVLADNNLDAFFDLSNFDISTGTDNGTSYSTINEYYVEDGSPANHTFGRSEVSAAFIMLDYALTKRLRVSGGVRAEWSSIFTDVAKFDSLNYKANDPRRVYSTSYPIVNPGNRDEKDYLPSVNLIYKLKEDELAPVNLRVNYSQTVARPSMRELSDVATLDYEYKEFVFGNSDLKEVHISNYDVRLESYFKTGDNISLSLFYKKFKDHIELVKSVGLTWQNVDKSQVAGFELEGRKVLAGHFEIGANIAMIWSQTKFVRNRTDLSEGIKTYIPIDTLTRTMYGQAPYVVNGILTYRADSIGFSVTASYNVQGARLVITSANPAIPDVYEMPRHLLDVKVNKRFGKHFNVNLTVRDILNSPVTRTYKDWDIEYDEYHYGTSYVLGVSYKL